jgi:ribosomal protein S18 acetylase RimI-like enzyme
VIEVVPADAVSLPGVATLAASVLEDPWSLSAWQEELGAPGGRIWVAREPSGLSVGFVAARRVEDELHVFSLGVAPERRRRGVGRRLLHVAVSAEPGARAAVIEVRAGDAGALRFYEALGFVAVGRRPRYYRSREDAVLMTRKL